ncbi:GIY-YIG nuclease family protein [Dechloromonas sp. ZS-1]|uniref:GIY-YIG nuclease family protein n=1 Tax=Dechloromonas sp. ZS-1 TaxID=3138067 RepID=UPI0031FE1AD6
MSVRGWVYVITNRAMPNLVKVGFSTKDPVLRAREFDGAALPYPYEVAYDALVIDPYQVEQGVHKRLNLYRENKEWFCCSISTAVSAIRDETGSAQIVEQFHAEFEREIPPVTGVRNEIFCPSCGTENMAHWYACRVCKTRFREPEPWEIG